MKKWRLREVKWLSQRDTASCDCAHLGNTSDLGTMGMRRDVGTAPPRAQLRTLFSHLAGVQSALYGLALSLLICVAAVAVFTTHVLLLLPVLLSILGMWPGASNRQRSCGGLPSAGFSQPLAVTSPQ